MHEHCSHRRSLTAMSYQSRITRVLAYGAKAEVVVAFPGVEGLIHISELSQRRVADPHEIVSELGVIARCGDPTGDPLGQLTTSTAAHPLTSARVVPPRYARRQTAIENPSGSSSPAARPASENVSRAEQH